MRAGAQEINGQCILVLTETVTAMKKFHFSITIKHEANSFWIVKHILSMLI